MKYFFVLALAFVGVLAAPQADDKDVLSDIEGALKTIVSLIPEPAVAIHGNHSQDAWIYTKSYNFVLKGIQGLVMSPITYDKDTGRLEYEWLFPSIEADLKYDLVLRGLSDPIASAVKVVLTKLKVSSNALVDRESSSTQLSDYKFSVSFEGTNISVKVGLNHDDITHKMEEYWKEQFPTVLNVIVDAFEPTISSAIKTLINGFLRTGTY